MLSGAGIHQADNCLAEYNEGFMNDARRFLKSDEGQAEAFYKRFYRHPDKVGVINFMTHVNGFTMMDLCPMISNITNQTGNEMPTERSTIIAGTVAWKEKLAKRLYWSSGNVRSATHF